MAITEIASAAAQAYSSQTGHGGGGLVAKSCPTLVTPWTVACQAPLSMRSPGKNTGVGYHFLLHNSRLNRWKWTDGW